MVVHGSRGGSQVVGHMRCRLGVATGVRTSTHRSAFPRGLVKGRREMIKVDSNLMCARILR